MDSATTLNGQDVSIMSNSMGVKVGNATVVKTDIEASNGLIHVVDSVLLPQ